jgi:C1A family cysteine protease
MIVISRYRKIFLISLLLLILGYNNVYADSDIEVQTVQPTDAYEKWNNLTDEEKSTSLMPSTYTVALDEEDETNWSDIIGILKNVGSSSKNASLESSFDLRSKMYIKVKDQGTTLACWTFAAFNSMETNIRLKYGTSPDFSEQHMNYATSQNFYDGTNSKGFDRKIDDGGSAIVAMAYLTNGQGAVLESQMPFDENTNNISLNDVQIDPSYYVKEYEVLPSIYKYKNDNGEMVYYDGASKIYTEEEIKTIRNQVKEHIVNYGGILAYTAASQSKYYNNTNLAYATAYYCDDINTTVDHAVTIVGWDDNYSKDNFTGAVKPNADGAYLILNSYSDQVFDEGYIWISYEDVWIESVLYGITSSSEIDYDNLYQNDWYGANVPITLTSSGKNVKEGYYASIYDRDSSKTGELLTEVSVNTNQTAKFEIYVNPNGKDLNKENLIKVATTDKLKSGYNTIKITPTTLTGEQFAVVVKQISDSDMYFMIEAEIDNSFYDCISAETGYSRVSLDGKTWYDLGDLGSINYGQYNIDLSTADVCVKAFTTFNGITTDEYAISADNYITKIYDNTTINNFLNKIKIVKGTAMFYTTSGEEVTDYNKLVTTGMILKIDNIAYTLVVRGDLNGDGKISLVDLSKHIAHYSEIPGFILSGAYSKAADINLDGMVSLIDVSQFLVLYNNM